MRRLFPILLLLLCARAAMALHIECQGVALQLPYQGDTILLFASNPEVQTLFSVGETDWYRIPDTIHPIQSGTNYLYPEHGHGYMLKVNGRWETFFVMDYDSLKWNISQMEAESDCYNTHITLSGSLPRMEYTQLSGKKVRYPRACVISYKDASWNDENQSWEDSTAVQTPVLDSIMSVPATALTTQYILSCPLAKELGLSLDSVFSPQYLPVALKAHPVSITTTRGDKTQPTGEVSRPYSKDDVLNMSAPLDILFRANGLNAEYFKWAIYKGTSLLYTRTDADHRFTFTEPGNYRVVVYVSNTNCSLDSVDFSISVSESMLLVPNVFTPNGDGANDEFRVAYRSIKEFHCWVYNRSGILVYQWSDPAKGWDGTIGGKPAAEGAYFYVIRALGTDAAQDAKYTWKPTYKNAQKKDPTSILGVYQLSGSINLLRGGK